MKNRDEKLIILENLVARDLSISATLGLVPFIGSYLSNAYNYRNEVQQQRLLHFLQEFGQYFNEITKKDFDYEYIQSEDFIDFFSIVIEKVKLIKSEEKISRFKEILINQIEFPYQSEFTSSFLDIAERINEDQLKILSEFRRVEEGEILLKYVTENNRGVVDGGDSSGKDDPLDYLDYKHFKFDESLYLFYLQDLIARGLIYDDGQGRLRIGPFKIIRITPFGLEFLKFIGKHA
jgi:hypothetical protein